MLMGDRREECSSRGVEQRPTQHAHTNLCTDVYGTFTPDPCQEAACLSTHAEASRLESLRDGAGLGSGKRPDITAGGTLEMCRWPRVWDPAAEKQ